MARVTPEFQQHYSYLRFRGMECVKDRDEKGEYVEFKVPVELIPDELRKAICGVGLEPSQTEDIMQKIHDFSVMNHFMKMRE